MTVVRKSSEPRRLRKPLFDYETFKRNLREYFKTRTMREKSEAMESGYKKVLMEGLLGFGTLDPATGNRRIDLDEEFLLDKRLVIAVERRRRVTQSLDTDATMALLERKDLLGRCTTTVTVLNEDAILGANYEGLITDEELKDLYTEKENFAFYPIYDGAK
jgi:hypothetical protein